MSLYDCCSHCEHGINGPPHDIPCPEGCTEDCMHGEFTCIPGECNCTCPDCGPA
jgi:hypothetical protein